MALMLTKEKPWLSGLLFALAVSFKVTPLFFLPWFFKRWKALYSFCLFTLVLWLVPLTVFGVDGYVRLLRDWYAVASNIGAAPSEFHYFPGQTLRALCLRFLTPIDPPVSGYPRVNLLSLTPPAAVKIWQVLAASSYAFVIWGMFRVRHRAALLWDGLAFVLYSILQPFAVKVSLISLGPAAVIGAAFFTIRSEGNPDTGNRLAARFYLAAALLSFGGACIQYKPYLRLLQAIGIDFWVSCLLGASLLLWMRSKPLPMPPVRKPVHR
jgi:Glycosyltransferase family 87